MSNDEYERAGAGRLWLRRDALRAAAGGILSLAAFGCSSRPDAPDTRAAYGAAPPAPVPRYPGTSINPDLATPPEPAPPLVCAATHDNIEGPYYRPGMPARSELADPGAKGTPLVVQGKVTGLECGRALAGAELDVWQADADGHYDNDGTLRLPADRFLLRGRIRADASGAYAFRTIVPGRYLNGARYRPAHIHVKLRSPGFRALTTQLYFPDDPYNQGDPFIHPSLVMAVEPSATGRVARFDFALPPAT